MGQIFSRQLSANNDSSSSSHSGQTSDNGSLANNDNLPLTICDLPDDILWKIFSDLNPWDLVKIRQTTGSLRNCMSNSAFLRPFLALKFKAPHTQKPSSNGEQNKLQIAAYQASIADAITGVDHLYLQDIPKLLQGLQALEVHQNGGFELGNNTSFVWYKNNLWACGHNDHGQLGLGANSRSQSFTPVPNYLRDMLYNAMQQQTTTASLTRRLPAELEQPRAH